VKALAFVSERKGTVNCAHRKDFKKSQGKNMTCIGNILVSGGKGTVNWAHRRG
jgi:hypothetical protein